MKINKLTMQLLKEKIHYYTNGFVFVQGRTKTYTLKGKFKIYNVWSLNLKFSQLQNKILIIKLPVYTHLAFYKETKLYKKLKDKSINININY